MSDQVPHSDAELLALSRDLRKLAEHLVRDPASADDVVQEAWLAALDRPPAEVRSLSDWMRVVVRNLALRRVRQERRRSDVEALAAVRDEVAFEAEVDARLATQRVLRKIVDELAEPTRDVLVMHYFAGKTLETVAHELDRPLETVRTQRRRGLAELRAALDRRHKGDRAEWTHSLLAVLAPWSARARRGPSWRVLAGGAIVVAAGVVAFVWWRPSTPASDPLVAVAPASEDPPSAPPLVAPVGESAREPGEIAASVATASAPAAIALRRFEVRVVTPEGTPVPDAEVTYTVSLDLPDVVAPPTDAGGRCVVELDATRLMGAPFFRDPARGVAVRARAAGYAMSRRTYVPIPEGGRAFEVVLGGPQQVVQVHVMDEEGHDVRGALVEVDKRHTRVSQDAAGLISFEAEHLDTTNAAGLAVLSNLDQREHELEVRAAGFVPNVVVVPAIGAPAVFEVRLSRGVTLVGIVRRSDGTAAAGAVVCVPRAQFQREAPPRAVADADGRFELHTLAPGATRIFARGAAPDTGFADAIVQLEERTQGSVELALRDRAPLRVRIEDADGQAVSGIVVVLATRPESPPAWRTFAVSDADGAASVVDFPSGLLECTLGRAADGVVLLHLVIDPEAQPDPILRVELVPVADLGRVRGSVLDHEGRALHAARMSYVRSGNLATNDWAIDAESGAFASTAIAPGLVRWIVLAREGAFDAGESLLQAGTTTELGALVTPMPGRARIAWSASLQSGARASVRVRVRTATADVSTHLIEIAVGASEIELLPHAYELYVRDAAGADVARVPFDVHSASTTEIHIP